MTGALDGQVACITGASRGFGRATALLLAREGADLVLNYRQARTEAETVVDEVKRLGRSAVLVEADVGDPAQAAAIATSATQAFGRVDVLVNNAGIMDVRPFADQDEPDWRAMIDVNVWGPLVLTHAVLPTMIRQGSGRIVCLSSQLGHVGGENFAVYSGTKGFLLAFVKSLAREVGQFGITVNAVCPGSIVTDMNRGITRRSVRPRGRLSCRCGAWAIQPTLPLQCCSSPPSPAGLSPASASTSTADQQWSEGAGLRRRELQRMIFASSIAASPPM
jgi:3-oxoacyl-[acyl-carrier protein] reductase